MVLPQRDGRPARPLPKNSTFLLRRLGPLNQSEVISEDDGESDSWELPSEEAEQSVASLTDVEPEDLADGAVLVLRVCPDTEAYKIKHCANCGDTIDIGTCVISWQVSDNASVYDLHPSCCAPFAKNHGIGVEMMTALVAHQQFAEPSLHGVMNGVLYDILDATKLSRQFDPFSDSIPAPVGDPAEALTEEETPDATLLRYPEGEDTIPSMLGDAFVETFPDTVQNEF